MRKRLKKKRMKRYIIGVDLSMHTDRTGAAIWDCGKEDILTELALPPVLPWQRMLLEVLQSGEPLSIHLPPRSFKPNPLGHALKAITSGQIAEEFTRQSFIVREPQTFQDMLDEQHKFVWRGTSPDEAPR